jgi:hypothetical protein
MRFGRLIESLHRGAGMMVVRFDERVSNCMKMRCSSAESGSSMRSCEAFICRYAASSNWAKPQAQRGLVETVERVGQHGQQAVLHRRDAERLAAFKKANSESGSSA